MVNKAFKNVTLDIFLSDYYNLDIDKYISDYIFPRFFDKTPEGNLLKHYLNSFQKPGICLVAESYPNTKQWKFKGKNNKPRKVQNWFNKVSERYQLVLINVTNPSNFKVRYHDKSTEGFLLMPTGNLCLLSSDSNNIKSHYYNQKRINETGIDSMKPILERIDLKRKTNML